MIKKREETEKEIETETERGPSKDRDSSRAIERTEHTPLCYVNIVSICSLGNHSNVRKEAQGSNVHTYTRRKIRPVDATKTERDR